MHDSSETCGKVGVSKYCICGSLDILDNSPSKPKRLLAIYYQYQLRLKLAQDGEKLALFANYSAYTFQG